MKNLEKKHVPMTDAAAAQAEKERRAAATAKRLETMRANLAALETRAECIFQKGEAATCGTGDGLTAADRRALLELVNVAYHDSGKIEGIYSVDSCAACDFCQRMRQASADNALMICGYCYAAADAWKEAAWRRHKLNARIFGTLLFTVEELRTLAIGALCRMNEDGDTVNETMARNYLRIFAGHPGTRFGYWYKNAPAVAAGLAAEGIRDREHLPENVRFIHSSALIGFPAAPLWFDDAIFTVYPDAETTLQAVAAGAHECNGKRCRGCGFFCYTSERQPQPVHIAEVLRASAAARSVIMAAYNARMQQAAARCIG